MPRARLATGHFEKEYAGAAERILINLYSEENGGDPERPVRLTTTPGSIDRDTGDTIQGNIRALAQADAFASGAMIILDGTTVRTWAPSTGTFGTISGTVAGTDRADVTFTQAECAILSGGTLNTSTGASFAAVTDPDFPSGLTSVATIAQRVVMTAENDRWHYTDVLDADSIDGAAFYTAESAPDNLIAARVLGETLLLFGGSTVESWFATGDSNDPFSRQPNVVQRGCLCRDGIQIIDNGCIWVADDHTVRSLMGMEAQLISPPWLSRLIAAEDPSDIISSSYEAEGHSFYQVNGTAFSAWYDLSTREWTLRKSFGSDSYDFCTLITVDGKTYGAKRTGSRFVEISRAYKSDEMPDANTFGTHIVREFSAHVGHASGRPSLGSVILEGAKGVGLVTGQGSEPVVQMRLSTDNGNTWSIWRDAPLGQIGEYARRTIWRRCGRGRRPQTVFHFRISDPVSFESTGVVWGEVS